MTKNKFKIKIMSSALSFVLIFMFVMSTMSVSSVQAEEPLNYGMNSDFPEERQRLAEEMELAADDEFIPVFIFLDTFDMNEVYDKLAKKEKINYLDYEDITRFEEKIVPELEKEVSTTATVAVNGDIEAHTEKMLDGRTTLAKKNYVAQKRKYVKETITSVADEFIASLDGEKIEVEIKSDYVEYLVLGIRKDYIDYVVNLDAVAGYGYADLDAVLEPTINSSSVVSNREVMGISYMPSEYLGEGITIGILEAVGYDENTGLYYSGINESTNPHLENAMTGDNKRIQWLQTEYFDTFSIAGNSSHTKNVTIIASGDTVELTGSTYSGTAPKATTYVTDGHTVADIEGALRALLLKGCDVINCSFGVTVYKSYSSVDQYFDMMSYNDAVTFVCSSGNTNTKTNVNDRDVTSPAKAFNVITVGNVNTSTGAGTYSMHPSSSYDQRDELYHPNKPDIVASGTNIYTVNDSGNGIQNIGVGTSYSAPFVTGIVARLMEKYRIFIGKPEIVKSIVMLSANPDVILDDEPRLSGYNSGDELLLYDKSGAGMIDGEKCIYIMESGNGNIMTFADNYVWDSPTGDFETVATITVPAGKTLRVILVSVNNTNEQIDVAESYTNVDLRVKSIQGSMSEESCSLYNNVEMVEFTAPSGGQVVEIQYATVSVYDGIGVAQGAIAWYIE